MQFSTDGTRLLAEYVGQDTNETWTVQVPSGRNRQLTVRGVSVTAGGLSGTGRPCSSITTASSTRPRRERSRPFRSPAAERPRSSSAPDSRAGTAERSRDMAPAAGAARARCARCTESVAMRTRMARRTDEDRIPRSRANRDGGFQEPCQPPRIPFRFRTPGEGDFRADRAPLSTHSERRTPFSMQNRPSNPGVVAPRPRSRRDGLRVIRPGIVGELAHDGL